MILASWWVWDHLWNAEQSTYITYDILDVIRFHQSQIISWLFTMIDNKIKSKSKARWNLSSITTRCTNSDGVICGHILKDNTWEYLPSDSIQVDDRTSTIISTAQVNHPYLLVEVVFEKQNGIIAPKIICYRLCDSTVLGKTLADNDPTIPKIFPTQRLQITSKGLTEAIKEKILILVNILESRSKQNIQKISCVYIVEDYKNCATKPDFKIKLHHTTEIILQKRKSNKLLTNRSHSTLLSESGYSEVSEMTTTARGYIHKFKCEGDFCQFNSEEEGVQLQLAEELEFNINRERKNAIQRNRSSDNIHDGNDEESDDENNQLYRSTVLAATHNPSEINTNHSVLNTSTAYKISMKSIYLARNEMKLLDTCAQSNPSSPVKESKLSPELRHWSPLLLNWYYRTGRSVIQKYTQPIVPIPISSGHTITKALLKNKLSETPRGVSEEEINSPIEQNSPKLTSTTLKQLHSPSQHTEQKNQFSQLIPYDLNENSYHPHHQDMLQSQNATSSKHLGRYYSSALVCERCYHVYKELNRLRKQELNSLIKNKQREEKEEKMNLRDENNSLYLAQKMNQMNHFANQRITTYRLSKSKHPPPSSKFSLENENDDARNLENSHLSTGAPKGVLPPLPWQLQHEEKRSEYQQQGSAFIKNIQYKTQQIIELTAKKNKEYYSQPHPDDGAEELDRNFDWKKTLLARHPSEQTSPSKNYPGNERIKSKSAGSGSRLPKKRGKDQGKKKKFDHERLLHPYQRYFEQMKREENSKNNYQSMSARTAESSGNDNRLHHPHVTSNSPFSSATGAEAGVTVIQQSNSHAPILGKRGKSYSTSLLPVFEAEEQDYSSSSKSQSTNSLLPPLIPRVPQISSNSLSGAGGGVGVGQRGKVVQLSPSKKYSSSSPPLSSHRTYPRSDTENEEEDGDDEEEDDDEEGIGWSPFVVSG